MNNLNKIPGFRTQNKNKVIATILYYTFFIGVMIGLPNIKTLLLCGSFIILPFVITEVRDIISIIKNKELIFTRKIGINIALIIVIIFSIVINLDSRVVSKQMAKEYKSIPEKVEKLQAADSKYYNENYHEIDEYLDLQVKYEEVCANFNEYKVEHPESLLEEVQLAKDDVNKYYLEAVRLEHKVKDAQKAKLESQTASSSNTSSSSNSQNGSYSNNSNNSSTNKHVGKNVYIANGNSYYHAIYNCKYLEGAKTSLVTLTSSMNKHECNCWTNPIVYKPSSNTGSSGSSSSGGKTVYVASGNSYYHKSPSCKFLNGASTSAVGVNNVGGKHPCNCVKY